LSFGGGSQYTLEYLVKVTNQGGTAGFSQINSGLTSVNKNVQNLGMSQEKLQMINDKVTASNNKVIQGTQGVSKAMKGLAFGVLGITTAGAEFVGMLSMWRTTQVSVKEATDAQSKALKEGGKNSKDYKDATNELAKANRWARMTFRNLMLSMFDMVPFFILTINGIVKLRAAYKALREAQLEQKAIQAVLKSSNIGLAQSNILANSSYASLTKTQRIAKAEQALMITQNEIMAASNTAVGASGAATIPILSKQTAQVGKLSTVSSKLSGVGTKVSGVFAGIGAAASGLVKKLGPILLIIGSIVVAAEAWKNNWGGVGDTMNQVGVKIGNIHPILKQTMEILAKVGLSVDALIHGDFSKVQGIWAGVKEEIGDTGPTEKQTKAMEELAQKVHEATGEAADFVEEIAMADKSGRKDFFKSLGITTGKTIFDNAKNQAKQFFNTVEDGFKKLNDVGSQLKTLRGIEAISKLGVKVGADLVKKIRFSMEDKLRDAFKGDKGSVFEKLADVIEKNAKASTPEFNAAVAQFAADTPGLVKLLEESGLGDIAAEIQHIIDEQKLGQTTGAAIKKSFQTPEFTNAIGDISSYIMGTNTDKKDEDTTEGKGLFDGIKTQIDQFVTDIPGLMKKVKDEFNKVDWSSIFLTFYTDVFEPMMQVALVVGEQIITNIWSTMVTTIDKRKSEGKIKLTLPDFFEFASDEITNQSPAVTKNFGPDSEAQKLVDKYINSWLEPLTNIENWNRWFEGKKKFFAEIPKLLFAHIENAFSTSPTGAMIISSISTIVDTAIQLKDATVSTWNAFGTAIGVISDFLYDLTTPAGWEVFVNTINDTVNALWDSYGAGLSFIGDYLSELIEPTWWTGFVGSISSTVNSVWSTFSQTLSTISSTVKTLSELKAPEGSLLDRLMKGQLTIPTTPDDPNKPQSTTDGDKISNISDKKNKDKSLGQVEQWYPGLTKATVTAIAAVQGFVDKATGLFAGLATAWSSVANSFGINAASGSEQVQSEISNMWSFITSVFDDLEQQWSETMAIVAQNAADASKGITDEFGSMVTDVGEYMSDLSSHWADMCSNMISEAENAADEISSELKSIPDEEVIVRVRRVFEFGKGGLMSYAKGGVMSAASGKMLTTNGPQMVTVGDNPGGHESIWAIPHDNPGPTVRNIDKMYRGTSGGGGGTLNQTLVLNIKGTDIINDTKMVKKIKTTIGSNRDRFGS